MKAAFLLKFLADLGQNNDREWFATQTERYQTLRAEFQEFVGEVLLNLADVRPAFGALDPAKCIFRIHRDVRFSKNKTPYKTHVSAVIGVGARMPTTLAAIFRLSPAASRWWLADFISPMPQNSIRFVNGLRRTQHHCGRFCAA